MRRVRLVSRCFGGFLLVEGLPVVSLSAVMGIRRNSIENPGIFVHAGGVCAVVCDCLGYWKKMLRVGIWWGSCCALCFGSCACWDGSWLQGLGLVFVLAWVHVGVVVMLVRAYALA